MSPHDRETGGSRGRAVSTFESFELTQQPFEPDGMVIEASGELDAHAAPVLRERLSATIDAGRNRIVVDLSGLSFIDSLSLAAVVRSRSRLGDDGRLALVASHPYVLLILQAGGLDSVLDVFATRDEALAHVQS